MERLVNYNKYEDDFRYNFQSTEFFRKKNLKIKRYQIGISFLKEVFLEVMKAILLKKVNIQKTNF